ncbi:SRPBCC family protein [Streptomyces sp. H39-S7]|uniref:SRPBCC family protein n=1 Tax=Streptomyces sp. H39-S7 TaxID=3004357 RepID=UPI0022AF400D|nr:SRPBCC family protein [Streptomyces sp. H39-S7]MCZ4119490.1 SRPBCC family protein [Streptomyces sp. H39-S7]
MSDDAGWPRADLDQLRRLRVVAGAARHALYVEHHFEAAPDQVWEVAADLEGELPHLIPGLRSFTPEGIGDGRPDGERSSFRAVSAVGHRERFEVVLRPGWCLMQSRLLAGGMAAVPEGTGTRFAFFSAYRFPGGAALQWLRRPGARARGAALMAALQRRIDARSSPGAAPGAAE